MAVNQLSNGNPDGTTLGQNSSDLVSFYGATPVARPSLPTALTTTPTTAELKAFGDSVRSILSTLGLAG